MKLSVIVPAYNEEKTIWKVLDKLKSVELIGGFQKEIVIVNDCSSDNTEGVAKRFIEENPQMEVSYYRHEYNQG
jgi:glycosyltransferase involved in cell wall biosynthesis